MSEGHLPPRATSRPRLTAFLSPPPLIHRNDWNDYVILAEGRHVRQWLNGQKTVDYTEPDTSIPQEGVFGLQIHRGTPAEAWYKDIMIRELPGK